MQKKMDKQVKDRSIYLEIFGESPINKILNFLVVFDQFDYSLTDIAKHAKISYSTLQLIWPYLEKIGIVKQNRVVGKAKMYKLNKDNPMVKSFVRFYWDITKTVTMKDINNKESSKRQLLVSS